jgi:hypothetical protein
VTKMTPAEVLRARVVTLVLCGVLVLVGGLYLLVGLLLWAKGPNSVPDALWLAAGTLAGALITWLNNSKGTESPVGPVPVTTAPGDAVAVEPL